MRIQSKALVRMLAQDESILRMNAPGGVSMETWLRSLKWTVVSPLGYPGWREYDAN